MVSDQGPFQKGARIKLVSMPNDPSPIPVGSLGTVTGCQDISFMGWPRLWQVYVSWDSGRSLSMLVPPDVAVETEDS